VLHQLYRCNGLIFRATNPPKDKAATKQIAARVTSSALFLTIGANLSVGVGQVLMITQTSELWFGTTAV